MAGAGYKSWVDGDVLSASDVNTYLMQQAVMVFADAAARSTAITAPSEGMVTYLTGTDVIEYYDGAAWQPILDQDVIEAKGDLIVGTADDAVGRLAVGTNGYILTADSGETTGLRWAANASGMNLITTGSISAGTSLNFDGCFTSTYRNYQIRCNFETSVGNSLRIRFRASGANNTTSNYQLQYFALNNTTITSGRLTNQPNLQISTNDANFQTGAVIDIFSPQEATETVLNCHFAWDDGSATTPALANYSGNFSLTDQFDGINLFILGGGTFTGDFAIYGMSN